MCSASDGGYVRTRWDVDLDAGAVAYDVCTSEDGGFVSPSVHRLGARALTPGERTTLDSAIAGVRSASPTLLSCGTDAPWAEFDVITAFGATVPLLDLPALDPPACQAPVDRQLVSGGWAVVTVLEGFAR
jgi:hypothetical protein